MRNEVFCLALAAACGIASAAVPVRPVSEPCNPMYLKGVLDRPWWNDAWRSRVPVVVSEMSTNAVAAYVADFELDLGKPGMAESVRVVTDYDEEVPCWAEEVKDGSGRVRLQFKTPLKAAENRAFLVYFDNPKAKRASFPEEVSGYENGQFYTLRNAALTLDFLRETSAQSALVRFKVNGSPADNELTLDSRKFASNPLVARLNGWPIQTHFTNRVTLVSSSPFKKQVRLENDRYAVTYTLYAGSDRLDYAYGVVNPKKDAFVVLSLSLSPGGGNAWDDLCYPALTGRINTDRAQLDYRRDSGDPIRHDIGSWSREGWYAFSDRKTCVSVGQFYAPKDVSNLKQGDWDGHLPCHGIAMGLRDLANFRGALFGTLLRADLIRSEYRVWANPPRVLAGRPEAWRKIEVRPPDMAYDFCAFQQTGPGRDVLASGDPSDAARAAKNVAAYLRRDGFNGMHTVCDSRYWWSWNPDRKLFDEIVRLQTNGTYRMDAWRKPRTWAESQRASRNLKTFLDGIHAEGIGLYHWGGTPLFNWDAFLTDPHARELDLAAHGRNLAAMGLDGAWCDCQGREGTTMMAEDWVKLGNRFWQWKDRSERERFFRMQDVRIEHARKFCDLVRKTNPKVRTVCWGCDLGMLGNEQQTLENAGDFDVVIQELMVGKELHRNERNRFGTARMRAMFNNEPHTVWNHFWSRIAGDDIRVGNCDVPFIYGVNGFNQEGDDYRMVDDEIVTKGTDFYRWAFDTGVARFSPKFVPVKMFNVFRDARDFRDDCMEGRCARHFMRAHTWDDTSETDGAANIWTTATAIHTDLTLNRYFRLENLKRYPALVLPHNRKLTKDEFETVKQYVRDGGVCFAEGKEFPFASFCAEGATPVEKSPWKYVRKPFGKGKFLYTPETPSLQVNVLEPGRPFRAFVVAETGVAEPFVVEGELAKYVDGMVRTDGKNWMLGTFALDLPGGTATTVRVKMNLHSSTSTPNALFALDLKSGRRTPFDGTLEFVQRPGECCQYLIGDAAFTAVPEYASCPSADFGLTLEPVLMENAAKNLAAREKLGDFTRPVGVLLFEETSMDGKPGPNPSHARGLYRQVLYSRANYEPRGFLADLKDVKLLQLMGVKDDMVERLFADCGSELADFLKRGGTIMFDHTKTTPAAQKFLAAAGVFDVTTTCVRRGDYWGVTNSSVIPETSLLYRKKDDYSRRQANTCYAKWDEKKQFAPFLICDRDKPEKDKQFAMCVCQEKVYGAGKVIFQLNDGAYTTWYEGGGYSDSLLSYATDINLYDHKQKVMLLNGGFGQPVEFPSVERNGF